MKRFGAVMLVCLALPATATAARVELRPGAVAGENELAYTAGADEVNHVYMIRHTGYPNGGLVWDVTDAGAPPIERVPPCEASTSVGHVSICPDDHVSSIVVDLGDRDDDAPVDDGFSLIHIPVIVRGGPGRDRIHMHSDGGNLLDGGAGNDVITSERWEGYSPNWPGGADTVNAGDGDDEIHTRDLERDAISCGPGVDEAVVDDLDVVAADCETVTRPYVAPSFSYDPWTRSDGLPLGVTINGSARYTNDRDVILTIRHPPGADALLISNDGGFSTWDTRAPRDSERYRFRLSSSGPERLPKTVYVRFNLDPTRTFTDDIVLDQRRPRVLRALLHRTRGGRVRISLKAHDSGSGVRAAQFALVRRAPWGAIKFHRQLTLRRAPSWVRVRDRAGNVSSWNRVTAPAG
jgi:hypothetical protein